MRILFAPVTEMIGGKRIKALLKNVKAEEMPKYNGLETDADGDNISKPSSGGSGSQATPARTTPATLAHRTAETLRAAVAAPAATQGLTSTRAAWTSPYPR